MCNLNSSDWCLIVQALEGEIKKMQEYQTCPHHAVADSASNHIKRCETLLSKLEEME